MARSSTTFDSNRARLAGKKGAKSLLKKRGTEWFKTLAQRSAKKRQNNINRKSPGSPQKYDKRA